MKARFGTIAGIASIVIIAIVYGTLNFYLRTAGTELVESWLRNEAISLQEGNYYSAFAKTQRIITVSSFIKGSLLAELRDMKSSPLAQFGDNIENARLEDFVGSVSSVQSGLFTFLIGTRLNQGHSIYAIFEVRPDLAPWLFGFVTIAILLSAVGAILVMRNVERIDATRRAELVSLAVRDLINGRQPSELLAQSLPGLAEKWSEMGGALGAALLRERDLAGRAAFSDLARQVAHDIASPLSSLNLIISAPEVKQLPVAGLLGQIAKRITAISNDLLIHKSSLSQQSASYQKVWPVVSEVVNEKNIELGADCNIQIQLGVKQDIECLFEPIQFGRIISNLLNNSIQALGDKGAINLDISCDDVWAKLRICDDGPGFPATVLSNFGAKAVSVGKLGGQGLGLSHAVSWIQSWGGAIKPRNLGPAGGAEIEILLRVGPGAE